MAPDSALVVPFPDVEPVVAPYRMRLDPNAPFGVPAHVTVHFPWVRADDVGPAELSTVRALARSVEPWMVTFAELRWFGAAVLWLAPHPDRPLHDLIERSAGEWPEYPRYDGEFEIVVPHLTIGDSSGGAAEADLRRAEAELASDLPLRAPATRLCWLARDGDGRWATRASFALGG